MEQSHIRSKVVAGILIITFGVLYFMHLQGFHFPFKILSWKTLLICIGIVHLVKKDFKSTWGYALVAVGTIFLLDDLPNINIDTKYVWPVLIVLLGFHVIYKALNRNRYSIDGGDVFFDSQQDMTSEDFFHSSAIFGGVEKNVVSKDFKGAKVSSVFGGSEINMMKADITGTAVIETNNWFGGTEIVVPADWEVKNNIFTLFGGVEDSRGIENLKHSDKILVLKGSCIFGGIEIKTHS